MCLDANGEGVGNFYDVEENSYVVKHSGRLPAHVLARLKTLMVNGMAYERHYDTGTMAAKIGMIRIIAPDIVDLMLDMLDDMRDRDVESHSGGSDWQECACGTEIARNACDGSGRYIDSEPHTCALTVLREVLSLAGER